MNRRHQSPAASALDSAVALMRHHPDRNNMSDSESGVVMHYIALHAQRKGILWREAMREATSALRRKARADSPPAPDTPIHSYTIGLITSPIPSAWTRVRKGEQTIDLRPYVVEIRRLIRTALTECGQHQLIDRLSIHPLEVVRESAASDVHIVMIGGEPGDIDIAQSVWPLENPTHGPVILDSTEVQTISPGRKGSDELFG